MSILDLFDDSVEPNLVTSTVEVDDFTRHASAAFDYEFDGTVSFQPWSMPSGIPEDFTIGAVVGRSGTGKSLFLRHFGESSSIVWERGKAIVSHFDTPEDSVSRLSAVGLNSIPSWMKPYHVLSLGEAFRADLARRMGDGSVFDEFTSVIDRDTAKSCSRSLKRIATQRGWKSIVVASCHEDILPWLQPDWVFNTNTGELSVGRWLRRPEIKLDIHRCRPEIWGSFAKHHYLTGMISPAAKCYVGLWDGTPTVFGAVMAFPHAVVKKGWREHRIVVLPEFQGMGIGPRFSDALARMYVEDGCRYFSRTAHPRLGSYRDDSPYWRPTSHNRKRNNSSNEEQLTWTHDSRRVCWAHEFVLGEVS